MKKHGRKPGDLVKARPQTDARAKAWTSMRVLLRFDWKQLVVTAGITRDNALSYMKPLRDAGYLRLVIPSKSGNGRRAAVYQLVRNTGPLAPITRRSGDVYDQNQQKVYAPGGAKGERDGQATP